MATLWLRKEQLWEKNIREMMRRIFVGCFFAFLLVSCSKTEQTTVEKTDGAPSSIITETAEPKTMEEIYDALPKDWTMLTEKDGKQIIYLPCDYQNEKIILSKEQSIYKLLHEIAQDGYYFIIENIENKDGKYIFTLREEFSDDKAKKVFYTLEIKDKNQAIWNVFDDEGKLHNITTTDSKFESSYKTVEEPPCLE